MQKAFTLIELLVVVLIIGILSAIALPQYQKAVMRTKVTQLLVRFDALQKSMQVYHLANGEYTDDVRLLDLDISDGNVEYAKTTAATTPHTGIIYDGNGAGERCLVLKDGLVLCSNADIAILTHMTPDNTNKWYCRGRQGKDSLGDKVCHSMSTGEVVPDSNYNDYPIN